MGVARIVYMDMYSAQAIEGNIIYGLHPQFRETSLAVYAKQYYNIIGIIDCITYYLWAKLCGKKEYYGAMIEVFCQIMGLRWY